MIQGKYAYQVDYHKKGKSNGKRSIEVYADDYEEVIWEFLLPILCEKAYGLDLYRHGVDEKDVVCKKSNNIISQYSISFRNGDDKVIVEYLIDMEVVGEKNHY